jgi:hypothetical protein
MADFRPKEIQMIERLYQWLLVILIGTRPVAMNVTVRSGILEIRGTGILTKNVASLP